MKKNHYIMRALITTILIYNPVSISANIIIESDTKINKKVDITKIISGILQNKGIEEEASMKISTNFIKQNSKNILNQINKIDKGVDFLSKDQILNFISMKALRKEKVNLEEYAYLVEMSYKILGKPLTNSKLKTLELLSKSN